MPTNMLPQKNIIIKAKSANQRLDIFLAENLNISRSQAQKLIEAKQIKINNQLPKKTGEKLKEGDTVVYSLQTTDYKRPTKTRRSSPTIVHSPLTVVKIIADTPHYIVVEKPWGMLTHATQANEENTLASWLITKFPELKNIGEDPVRPGIVHRLDKEASGLLVVARTQEMFEHLKNQFKKRTVVKEYAALVHGKVEKDWDEINFHIARSETSEKMAAVPKTVKGLPSDTGKEAITEFLVEERFVNFTMLNVKIHTGRTHQIRAHLFAYNHPIVGDPLYFQKKQKRDWDEKCGRLFLHCTRLGFKDMDKKLVKFESPLPEELSSFIKTLKHESIKTK